MTQALLDLPADDAALPADPVARTGFHIGWDHAHHGLVPPAESLLSGMPLSQGWLAGKAVFGRRTLAHNRFTRQWLALRTLAWRRGIAFEDQQLTPHHLAQIDATHCPVLRTPLGGPAGHADAAMVERLNPQAGYAAGNVAVMSQRAASARDGVDVLEAVRRANRAQSSGDAVAGLDAAAWQRLAVLPPNRVRLLNAPQGLQELLTRAFATPGWAARTRAMAAMLPQHSLRHDFNLFVGAFAPRVLEAPLEPAALRHALEDAWLNDRVQRRWHHLVMSLGEAATAALLHSAAAAGVAGVRTLHHAAEQATDGWALAAGGHADGRQQPAPRRLKPAPPWRAGRPAPAVQPAC